MMSSQPPELKKGHVHLNIYLAHLGKRRPISQSIARNGCLHSNRFFRPPSAQYGYTGDWNVQLDLMEKMPIYTRLEKNLRATEATVKKKIMRHM